MPGPLVAGLFLAPEYISGLRVALDLSLKIIMGKRIQLLDPDNCDIFDFVFTAISQQIVINLAAAGDDAPDILRIKFSGFGNDGLKPAASDILETRRRFLMAQQTLWTHEDKGLAQRTDHLPPQ